MKEIKTLEEFETIISDGFKIINVKTTTCGVCQSVTKQLEDLLTDYDVDSYYIFSDLVKEFSGQYLVFTVPTILIFNDGQEILRESRFINYGKIVRLLDMFLEK